jgi:hypothetical protein
MCCGFLLAVVHSTRGWPEVLASLDLADKRAEHDCFRARTPSAWTLPLQVQPCSQIFIPLSDRNRGWRIPVELCYEFSLNYYHRFNLINLHHAKLSFSAWVAILCLCCTLVARIELHLRIRDKKKLLSCALHWCAFNFFVAITFLTINVYAHAIYNHWLFSSR